MSERLREWRREHRLTQVQLARALGVDAISVSRWERGTQEPPEEMLDLALAELTRRLTTDADGEPGGGEG